MRSMVNIISENHDQLHWVSGKESRSTDGKLASSKIWTTQSKSSTDTFYLYQITISIMIQNDGGKTSNTSELASSQEAIYVPYSKRNPQNCPDDRFCNIFDYLERVIWVDMENAVFHDWELDWRKTKFVVLPNGRVLMANSEVASLSDEYTNEWPKWIFFVMLSDAFFWTYQTVFPYFRKELIS